ncbi:MAG: methylmalonyl-CoA mutase, partial [Armatimonadetes bacterium]|nr:methylmalonyl-CoA mutase [Armatimonadota bacterium]
MTVKSKAGLYSDESLEAIRAARKNWEGRVSKKNRPQQKVRKTSSGEPIEILYTPLHQGEQDYLENIGFPGEYPYTRGIHPTMYRGKPWTMRMFSGFATPRRTNERYHFLLGRGQDGLSVAFDMPTLMGRDSDDPLSLGEVGKCGVAISTLKDMEIL